MPGVGDIYLVTAFGRCFGQVIMLTHHYKVLGFNPGTTDNEIRASILSAVHNGVGGGDVLESAYLACLPDSYILNRWQCQKVHPERLAYATHERSVNGTHGEAAVTPNLAAVITLRGGAANRANVSNKHIGPTPDTVAVMEEGYFKPAYKTLLETLGASLLSQIVDLALGLSTDPVTYHSGPVPGSNTLLTQTVQLPVRVMRQRSVGYGI